jgi:hypothetical protein
MVVNYFDTGYRYIDGIRFFKENDPYFYKVDNIPLKQFDENIKFLKDQTDGLLQQVSKKLTLGRDGFTELQPYVDGFDSIVKVRPGRYTARVNDAYSIDPLQTIRQFLGEGSSTDAEINTYAFGTASNATIIAIMQKWHAKLSSNATNMNGLYERTFVYPTLSIDAPGDFTDTTNPNTFSEGSPLHNSSPYPGYTGTGILHTIDEIERGMKPISVLLNQLFNNAGRMEAEFIRRWRGVTRTAIVDVPTDLSIEIPPFDESDFFYIDTAGVQQSVTALQRIDLLFIYSKPIDQSETTLASYTNGVPRTINAPVLGIVKGAGIGVNQTTATNATNRAEAVSLQNLEGVTLMLPNPSDELSEDTGFSLSSGPVKGSFPSPDDLMNLAPLISEKLESTATPLIGQSILPIAYIVVKASTGTNSNGTSVITSDDVIDIRPLLRTTELAYNERAGIAASFPQISIANPVASENYVENVSRDIVLDYTSKVDGINSKLALGQSRVLAAGSIKGGMYYGVEGALASYAANTLGQITEYEQAKNVVENRYFYPAGSIPDLPDWDVAHWCRDGNYSGKGDYPTDRVQYHQYGMQIDGPETVVTPLQFGPFLAKPIVAAGIPAFDAATNPRIGRMGTDDLARWGDGVNKIANREGAYIQYYVSKTILLDKSLVSWATDYFVNVQLWNCVPLSCRTSNSPNNKNSTSLGSSSNIWVDKRANSFTIYVSWVANDPLGFSNHPERNEYDNSLIPSVEANRNNAGKFAGFSVINQDIVNTANPNSSPAAPSTNAGVALYPTVSFQVVGIPQQVRNNSANLNGQSPTITLI